MFRNVVEKSILHICTGFKEILPFHLKIFPLNLCLEIKNLLTVKNNVYEKLHEYDILLFPSRWKGEGVPGILIESKMAGIVPIVSDHLYNSEIVLNNIEGIVLEKKDIGLQMSKTIKKLLEYEDIYNNLANGAFTSRMRYSLETYKELFPKWLFE